MNSKRTFYLMIGVLVLLIGAIFGGTYLANQELQKQSVKLAGYKLQDQVLSQEQTGLTKAKKDIATYSSLEKIAKVIVPQDKDQAKAVREIINIAAESGIKPTAIAFPASTLGGVTSASGNSPSANTKPSAAVAQQQALSQLTPVKTITGVYNLRITIQLDSAAAVPYAQFIDFLSRLEQNRRTAQVTGIILQPSPINNNLVSFTLTVDEFIKP